MKMWLCDAEHCNNYFVRMEGECVLCNRHLCVEHLVPEYHACPKWEVSLKITDSTSYVDLRNRTKSNMTLLPNEPNRMKSRNLLAELISPHSFLEPLIYEKASLVPYHMIFNIIGQHEARLWGE